MIFSYPKYFENVYFQFFILFIFCLYFFHFLFFCHIIFYSFFLHLHFTHHKSRKLPYMFRLIIFLFKIKNSITMLLLILGGILFALLFYNYAIKPMSYWKKRGVKQGKSVWLFGDFIRIILRKETLPDTVVRLYQEHPNER